MLDPESQRVSRLQTPAVKPYWQPDMPFLPPLQYPTVRYDLLTRVCD